MTANAAFRAHLPLFSASCVLQVFFAIISLTEISLLLCGRGGKGPRFPLYFFWQNPQKTSFLLTLSIPIMWKHAIMNCIHFTRRYSSYVGDRR
jgi:hypothetical protein